MKTSIHQRTRTAGRGSVHWLVAPAICLLLLSGVAVDRMMFHLPVGDPGPYHARVKEAIDSVPRSFGDWVGKDEPVPQAATELLRPNTILARKYVNRRTGARASLMIVHCTDARDIKGHYPPVCYPANGWEAARGEPEPRNWNVNGLEIPGREYVFYSGNFTTDSGIVVYSFILRPDGAIDRDMRGLGRTAYDPRLRPYGGGQVQVLFDQSVARDARDEAFAELIAACLPAIRTVLNGVEDD